MRIVTVRILFAKNYIQRNIFLFKILCILFVSISKNLLTTLLHVSAKLVNLRGNKFLAKINKLRRFLWKSYIFFTFPCFQSYWVFTCDLQYFCKQTAATTKCKQIRVFRRCLHYRTSDRQASGWPLEVRLYGKIGIITAILRFSYSTQKLVQVRPSLIWYRIECQRWKSKWQLKQV